jgi:hypothetical protein
LPIDFIRSGRRASCRGFFLPGMQETTDIIAMAQIEQTGWARE